MTTFAPVAPSRQSHPIATVAGWTAVVVLVAAPLAVAVLRYVLPYYSSTETEDIVRDVATHPGAQQLVIWLGFFATLTLPVAAVLAGRYLYAGAPRLTAIAELLLVPAYLCLGWLVVGDAILHYGAEHDLDPTVVGDMYEAIHPAATVALVVFVVGHVLGTVLLGLAAIRNRTLPRWAGIALAVSQPLHFVAFVVLGSPTLDFVAWTLNAAAFGAIGVAAMRRSDGGDDGGDEVRFSRRRQHRHGHRHPAALARLVLHGSRRRRVPEKHPMRPVLVLASAALLVTGCGSSDTDGADSPKPASAPTAATRTVSVYATQVQELCDNLIDQVVPVTGDSAHPTGAKFLQDREQLRPVWDAFDAQVAALEVADVDRAVADMFAALLAAADAFDEALDARLAEVTEMDADEFEAAMEAILEQVGWRATSDELAALGIACPAR